MLPLPMAAALAGLQFAWMVGWLAYAVCLPPLVVAAGLPASATPWILLLDQALFVALDLALAMAAGPVLRARERAAPLLLPALGLSVLALFLLPPLTRLGPVALVVGLLVWVVSSAVLRAPVLLLFARHVPPERHPGGLSLALVGAGLAAALAPFAAVHFRASSPFFAFTVASLLLVASTVALILAERRVAPSPPPPRPGPWTGGELIGLLLLVPGVVALSLSDQIHGVLRAGDLLGAVLSAEGVLWVTALGGACSAVVAALGGVLGARVPAPFLVVLGAAGLCAGVGVAALANAPVLVAASAVLAAGAAGLAGVGALESAATTGRPGRQGLFLGAWSGAGALAAALRLGLVATGATAAVPGFVLDLAAAALSAAAGAAFLLLLASRLKW